MAAGCSGKKPPPPELDEAVRLLQLNQPQKAIDELSDVDGPRAHYLRSIALDRLNRNQDAQDQIAAAVEGDPENDEYRGLQLRLKLPERLKAGDFAPADELIKLRERHRTSASLALFGFYAHVAKAQMLQQKKSPEAARQHAESAARALQTSIALSADVPEFHRELLDLAVSYGQDEGAEIIAGKLHQAAPDDPGLQRERVMTLLKVHKVEEAVDVARDLHREEKSEASGVLYSRALRPSRASADRDLEFKRLVDEYPASPDIASNRALYLARTRRIAAATETLTAAIEKQKDAGARRVLIDIAVTLPLEARDAVLAEQMLETYRTEIGDESALNYFEGRLLYLKKDHAGALEKLTKVIDAQKSAAGPQRRLATEALMWAQTILRDKEYTAKLNRAVRGLAPGSAAPPRGEEASGAATAEKPMPDETLRPQVRGESDGRPPAG